MFQGETPLVSVSLGAFSRSTNGLTQFPFKLLPLFWDSEHMRCCAHPLRVGSLFPSVLPLTLLYTSMTGLQEAYLLIESLHNPQAGELSVRFRLLAPWGEFCYCDYPAVCGLPTQDKALTMSCLCPFYLTHCHLFFISVAVKNIVCWYPGISYTQLLCKWLYF